MSGTGDDGWCKGEAAETRGGRGRARTTCSWLVGDGVFDFRSSVSDTGFDWLAWTRGEGVFDWLPSTMGDGVFDWLPLAMGDGVFDWSPSAIGDGVFDFLSARRGDGDLDFLSKRDSSTNSTSSSSS